MSNGHRSRPKLRHATRYAEIAAVLARHGRGDLVDATALNDLPEPGAPGSADTGSPEAAERLAADLESLGPTFIKLGQLASTRTDLLPPAYTEALSRLQDDVEPFSHEEVDEIVSTELGVRLSRVYRSFDTEPLAAASLGQVHRATLRDGREVVVKVQRPGIRNRVLEDVEVLTEIATFADTHSELGRRYGLTELVDEFRRSLRDELDYRREAQNLSQLREILRDHEDLVVPAPVDDLTTSRVLTMEYVSGRKITEIGGLGHLELDGARLADSLFAAYIDQVLVHGLVHADPHPGNVLVTDDGRLALIDIGMVSRVEPGTREKLIKLFLALIDGRSADVTRLLESMAEALPDYDPTAFGRAVADVVARTTDANLSSIDVGATVLSLTRSGAEAGLKTDPTLLLLGKALLNLDQVAAQLDPGFDPQQAMERHLNDTVRRTTRVTPAALFSSLLEAKEFVEHLPGRVNRAFDAIGEGHFELRVKAFDEEEFLAGLHKLANVVAGGLILAAMILASALLARTDGGPTVTSTVAMVVFVVSVLIALVMLWRVMWQTRRLRARTGSRLR